MNKIRGQRSEAKPVVFTERDFNILLLTGLNRYLSTAQLAREFFTSADRCQHRLRQLYDAGYLNITLAGSTHSNLLSLTSLGLSVVVKAQPGLAGRLHLAGAIRLAGVRHHLLVADARLYVAALAKQQGSTLWRWSNSGGEMSEEIGLEKYRLEPDGLAELQTPQGILRLAVEADCGTETATVVEHKLEKYAAVIPIGLVRELWLVVAGGKKRQDTLTTLAEKTGLAKYTRLFTAQQINERPVKQPPERLAGRDRVRQNPNPPNRDRSNSLSQQGLLSEDPAADRLAVRRTVRLGT